MKLNFLQPTKGAGLVEHDLPTALSEWCTADNVKTKLKQEIIHNLILLCKDNWLQVELDVVVSVLVAMM